MPQDEPELKRVSLTPPTDPALARKFWLDLLAEAEKINRALLAFAKSHDTCFFLQIGAHDGRSDDPLHELVRKHEWRGVLIEPVDYLFKRLSENYQSLSYRLSFENKAIASTPGQRTFYRMKTNVKGMPPWFDQLGSFDREVILRSKAVIPEIEKYIEEQQVECVTVSQLLEKYAVETVDLILIDTEGYDFEVLKMIDFTRIHPDLLIYERKHLSDPDARASLVLLQKAGYQVDQVGANCIASRRT